MDPYVHFLAYIESEFEADEIAKLKIMDKVELADLLYTIEENQGEMPANQRA